MTARLSSYQRTVALSRRVDTRTCAMTSTNGAPFPIYYDKNVYRRCARCYILRAIHAQVQASPEYQVSAAVQAGSGSDSR
jgi:hypothetical protein